MLSSSKDPAGPGSDQIKPKLPSLEPDDPEIDSLTKLLDRTLRLQTQALAASRLVEVDKKYSLYFATTPSQFYKWRAHAKRTNKRKRAEGILPKSIEGDRIGFRPEELIWNGALDMKVCRPSNLTNEIHSLFGRNRFDDCPDYIYDQFIPALRLATLFLTKPICFQFWVTVGLGKRKFDEEGTRRYGYATERIEKMVSMTEENASQLINYIKDLDQSTLVHFGFKPALELRGSHAWAVAQEICDYYVEKPRRPFTEIRRHNVRLHGDFYIAAKRLAQLTHPDPAQQLRFHFFLAVVLLHEVAHVVEGAHRHVHSRSNTMTEPFLFDHNIKEMGAAWESMMFGGRIQPINGRVDATHGLSVSDWPGDEDFDESSVRRIFYSIPMGYIEGLFQKQNWERKRNLQNWKEFHIPRTGAVSIHLNCFTTMQWEEEVLDMTSTIAEDLGLSEPDEPARKRRETRTGSPVIEIKGYGEEEKPGHPSSRKTKTVPSDRPQINRRNAISAASSCRDLQAMKSPQDEARARTRERVIEEVRGAGWGSRKSKTEKKAIYSYSAMTDKSHDLNDGPSIQKKTASENLEEEETSTTGNPNKLRPQSLSQLNISEELYHPRIRGLKRAATADDKFYPTVAKWPELKPKVLGSMSNDRDDHDETNDKDNGITTSA